MVDLRNITELELDAVAKQNGMALTDDQRKQLMELAKSSLHNQKNLLDLTKDNLFRGNPPSRKKLYKSNLATAAKKLKTAPMSHQDLNRHVKKYSALNENEAQMQQPLATDEKWSKEAFFSQKQKELSQTVEVVTDGEVEVSTAASSGATLPRREKHRRSAD